MRQLAGLGTKGNRLLLQKRPLTILDEVLKPGTVELLAMSQEGGGRWYVLCQNLT